MTYAEAAAKLAYTETEQKPWPAYMVKRIELYLADEWWKKRKTERRKAKWEISNDMDGSRVRITALLREYGPQTGAQMMDLLQLDANTTYGQLGGMYSQELLEREMVMGPNGKQVWQYRLPDE